MSTFSLKPVVATLTFAVVVFGGLLMLDKHTEDQRKQQAQRIFHETLMEVAPIQLSNDYQWRTTELKLSPSLQAVYPIYQQGYQGAVIKIVATEGYNGPIQLLLGIRANHEIHKIRVLQHDETPGLGDQIETHKSSWMKQFNQHPINKALRAQHHLSGATITERAVLRGLNEALATIAPSLQRFSSHQP